MKDKQKKKRLPLGRTLSNSIFALKIIAHASPIYLAIYLSSSIIYGMLAFLNDTFLLRMIVNNVQAGEAMSKIAAYVLTLAAVSVIFYVGMSWYWNIVSVGQRRKIIASVEKMLFRKSAQVELACYENPEFYDKYVRAMDEACNRVFNIMNTLDLLIWRIVALSANTILLFVIDPWLILFGLFPLVLGVLKRVHNKIEHERNIENKKLDRKENYIRRAFYLGEYAKEMRMGGMYVHMLSELGDMYKDYKANARKYGIPKFFVAYAQTIGLDVITVLGATLYAVWRTMAVGDMSVGDCIVVIGSIGTVSYCLNNLIQNFAQFGEHSLFLEDVRFFLDYEIKIRSGDTPVPSGGDIEFKGVSFKYDGSDRNVLEDISFVWHEGERIALVGSNGSGKTTLVKLLMRLYDPEEGEILYGGTDIRRLRLDDYRACFGTVFQDFKMFSMSVKDNVLLRPEREGDRKLVEAALRESGSSERIEKMKNGIDTILTREFDSEGENLSVGEAQKVSLARIFADPTSLVVLDEPSSALDPIAEYNMFENMMRATEGRRVIFISHRLSSAVLADHVILMENGRICEYGTHSELMERNGKYAEMFTRQAENYLGERGGENE